MNEFKNERPEWLSFHGLVQDFIAGAVKRHAFNQWELEFLLDVQESRLRRSSREVVLRKYLRIVQQRHIEGDAEPPRLGAFLASEYPSRSVVHSG